MGDLIEDIMMAKHLHDHEDDILSIGFFNNLKKDGERLLVEYQKNFDVVVMNDGNLHFLHYFLNMMGKNEGRAQISKRAAKAFESMLTFEDFLKEHKDSKHSDLTTHYARKQYKINKLFEKL